jgi:hypothetical protein
MTCCESSVFSADLQPFNQVALATGLHTFHTTPSCGLNAPTFRLTKIKVRRADLTTLAITQ